MTVNHEDIRIMLANISEGYPAQALTIYLQPIVSLVDGRCLGAEALVRGRVANKIIFPDRFIGLLEQNRDIRKVGVFVLQSAIQFAKKNNLHQLSDFTLSSNFSPIEINDRSVVEKIKSITDDADYPRHKVTIEITETNISLSKQGRDNAKWLQQHGFVIAWDDISNLDDLNKNSHEFCSNVIKLDRSLLNKECLPLAQEIILLCQRKKLQLVAEGVEYSWQRDWLLEQGVTVCQGYYYSRPVKKIEFVQNYILK